MAGIGHNSGRVTEDGGGFRRVAWAKARRALLPTLPIEVVRIRVARAKALGLPYKTYAGMRASTGHDLIGFLFSSNALGVWKAGQDLPADVVDKLDSLSDCDRTALAHVPLTLRPPLDAVHPAPAFTASWSVLRDALTSVARARGHPADRYMIVGDTAVERDWSVAARAAGYISADQYFGDHLTVRS